MKSSSLSSLESGQAFFCFAVSRQAEPGFDIFLLVLACGGCLCAPDSDAGSSCCWFGLLQEDPFTVTETGMAGGGLSELSELESIRMADFASWSELELELDSAFKSGAEPALLLESGAEAETSTNSAFSDVS